ncbi:MAG: hypothetical protein ACAH17_01550, partial [Candidatus Paceibacterota bacterium]
MNLQPGRELDALVAEKVMGIKHIHYSDPVNGMIGRAPKGRDYMQVPNYSTDIAAAWTVVQKVGLLGGGCVLSEGNPWSKFSEDGWYVLTPGHYESAG